jgi:hypothetical protein
MESISWLIRGPHEIWYLTDIINLLRGVFIFYFCVWSNKKVRKSFLGFFDSRFKQVDQSDQRRKSSCTKDTDLDTTRPLSDPSLAKAVLSSDKQDTPL